MKQYLHIFALLALLPVASLATSRAEIELLDEIVTNRTVVVLRDVATLHSEDEELRERLLDVPVARAPRVGQQLLLTRRAIGSRLESEIPGLFARSTWSGPSNVRIRAVGRNVDLAPYRQLAKSALRAALERDYEDLTIEPTDSGPVLALPAGRVEVTARIAENARIRKC